MVSECRGNNGDGTTHPGTAIDERGNLFRDERFDGCDSSPQEFRCVAATVVQRKTANLI